MAKALRRSRAWCTPSGAHRASGRAGYRSTDEGTVFFTLWAPIREPPGFQQVAGHVGIVASRLVGVLPHEDPLRQFAFVHRLNSFKLGKIRILVEIN